MPDETKNETENSGRQTEPLTDEEIASLLGDDLSPEQRAELVSRLNSAPESAEILAIAASRPPESPGGFTPGRIDIILKKARETLPANDICPNCSGDLHKNGKFCPHCGVRLSDNPLKCLKCGANVVEGSSYCPKCGALFGYAGGRWKIHPRFTLLLIGLVSIGIALVWHRMFLPFLILGLLSTGAWVWEIWTGKTVSKHAETGKGKAEEGEKVEKKKDHRLTG